MDIDYIPDDTITVDDTCSLNECKHKDTYTLDALCMNCGLRAAVRFTVGHDKRNAECPQCGTKKMRPKTRENNNTLPPKLGLEWYGRKYAYFTEYPSFYDEPLSTI